MKRARPFLTLLFAILAALGLVFNASRADTAPEDPRPVEAPAIPTGKGLPVIVKAAVQFIDVAGIDENAQTFDATLDVRLRWESPGAAPADVRDEAVDALLAQMWAPKPYINNLVGDPAYRERGLTVDRHGRVELLERVRGTFSADLDERDYPFDTQHLPVEVALRGDDLDRVNLVFHGDDVEFSNGGPALAMTGWDLGLVDLRASPIEGWRHKSHARVIAHIQARRQWLPAIPPIFIPLFSSMLIPLIAIWLQKVDEEGEFQIDAFELANILIGGLFAVIALNFTVNAEHSALAAGDNTVNRLFGLNYTTLAAAIVIDIAMFQFNWIGRWFGKYVQEQLFLALCWALPALSLGTALACLAVSWF